MSPIKQLIRLILILHGLLNVAQGFYSISNPTAWAELGGPSFHPSTNKALQSIGIPLSPIHNTTCMHTNVSLGLGCIGVGAYGAWGALSNNRSFYVLTFILRLTFATIAYLSWGWEENAPVIMYEGGVAILAAFAATL
jgi:hypothetical protein